MVLKIKKFVGNLLFGLGIFVIILAINMFPAITPEHNFYGWGAISYLGIYLYISIIFLIVGSYLISSN